jgi:hypothetical protein
MAYLVEFTSRAERDSAILFDETHAGHHPAQSIAEN